jgi:hypothetical protein
MNQIPSIEPIPGAATYKTIGNLVFMVDHESGEESHIDTARSSEAAIKKAAQWQKKENAAVRKAARENKKSKS